jgi:hypothetical protein
MNFITRGKFFLLLLLICLCYNSHLAQAANTAAPTAPAAAAAAASPGPAIDGFRNAKFGMSETAVRGVVQSEFKLPASAITQSENQLQHTAVLSVQVPELVPGGGAAAVSYVFGYTSHKLIEVNILWSPEIDPKTTPAMLYQNGESLQQYFASEGFPADRSTGNIATPNGVLLFRATDPTGNAVLLILSGTITKNAKSDKSVLNPTTLTLAYAADPMHPDVFELAKGSF